MCGIASSPSPVFVPSTGRRNPQSRDMHLLQVPRLLVHVAGLGWEPVSPRSQSLLRSPCRRAGAALQPLGDWPSGLACDFLNVASQLLARPLNSLLVQLGSGPCPEARSWASPCGLSPWLAVGAWAQRLTDVPSHFWVVGYARLVALFLLPSMWWRLTPPEN